MTGRRHLLHPRRRRLLAWLDTDDATIPSRVTTHLETCGRCAARLGHLALGDASRPATDGTSAGETSARSGVDDGFAEPEPDDLDRAVAAAIADGWVVPEELPQRVRRAITARERHQREFELLLGLVSIAKDTAELLLPDDRRDVDDPIEPGPTRPEMEDPS